MPYWKLAEGLWVGQEATVTGGLGRMNTGYWIWTDEGEVDI